MYVHGSIAWTHPNGRIVYEGQGDVLADGSGVMCRACVVVGSGLLCRRGRDAYGCTPTAAWCMRATGACSVAAQAWQLLHQLGAAPPASVFADAKDVQRWEELTAAEAAVGAAEAAMAAGVKGAKKQLAAAERQLEKVGADMRGACWVAPCVDVLHSCDLLH